MIYVKNKNGLECIDSNNNIKCSQCKNTDFIKCNYPIKSFGEGNTKVSKFLESFMCDKCGHIEQFYTKHIQLANDLNQAKEEYEIKTNALRSVVNDKQEYFDNIELRVNKAISDKKNKLNEMISNKNNTVFVVENAQKELDNLNKLNTKQKYILIGIDIDDLQKEYNDFKSSRNTLSEFEKKYKKIISEIERKYQDEYK